jgi:hypothetical protein
MTWCNASKIRYFLAKRFSQEASCFIMDLTLNPRILRVSMTVSNDYSYVSSSDNLFIDGLYKDYKRNPESVDVSWRQFFRGFEYAATTSSPVESTGVSSSNLSKKIEREHHVEHICLIYVYICIISHDT